MGLLKTRFKIVLHSTILSHAVALFFSFQSFELGGVEVFFSKLKSGEGILVEFGELLEICDPKSKADAPGLWAISPVKWFPPKRYQG